MARKKQEGVTTSPRYKGKMYAVAYGIFAGNEELAKEYAEALTYARTQGFGEYHSAWLDAKDILARMGVPSALWGLYKAFVNELIHKVKKKQELTKDQVIQKWIDKGLDPDVLSEVADVVIGEKTREVPKSAEKA